MTFRPGICSVTYRNLSVPEIIDASLAAGLECIEWGGDVHVPAGDVDRARQVRALTEGAGLAVASYGSYVNFQGSDDDVAEDLSANLASTEALGANLIRVWATRTPSAEVSRAERADVVRRVQLFADLASERGIGVGFEFHRNTLTDSVESTQQLLAEVKRDNVSTYWQPNVGLATGDAIATLEAVLGDVSTVHAFAWWPEIERLPLAERSDLWERVAATLQSTGRDHDVLLEFVPDDDPTILPREAATLRRCLGL